MKTITIILISLFLIEAQAGLKDRKRQTDYDAKLISAYEVLTKAETCGATIAPSIKWDTISSTPLMAKSVPSYCDIAFNLKGICKTYGEDGKTSVRSIKKIVCSYNKALPRKGKCEERMAFKKEGDTLNIQVTESSCNISSTAGAWLENNL